MTKEEITKHYESLRDIVHWVRESWHFFDQLYRSGQENIELLNRSAGWVFYRFHDSLYVSVLIRICALTDQSKSLKKHNNLSFEQLAVQIKEFNRGASACILYRLEIEQPHFAHLRTLRNKAIAHIDLETAGTHSGPHSEIDPAIEALLRILDSFEEYLAPSEKRWKHHPHYPPGNTGNDLIQILRHREELIKENIQLRNQSHH